MPSSILEDPTNLDVRTESLSLSSLMPIYSSDGSEPALEEAFPLPVAVKSEARTERAPRRVVDLFPVTNAERDAFYSEFAPLVRRLIRQYGGDDAEMRSDLSGEIYCRYCHLLDVYDPARGVPLRPYLIRQLTTAAYTFARHHWRRNRRETSLDLGEGSADPSPAVDPTPTWNHDLAMQQVLNTIPTGIAQLPLRQRQVVIWRYYEQRSFEEIAERMDIRVATARSILRHGLNNLRKWIAQQKIEWE